MLHAHNRLIFLLSMALTIIPTSLTSHVVMPPSDTAQELSTLVHEVLTEEALFAALTSQTPTVVMGSMERCPNCSMFKPHYAALAKKYPKVNFVSVDGPKLVMHKKVAKLTNNSIKIPGYPTTVLVNEGSIIGHVIGGNKQKLETMVADIAATSKQSKKRKREDMDLDMTSTSK